MEAQGGERGNSLMETLAQRKNRQKLLIMVFLALAAAAAYMLVEVQFLSLIHI